MFKHFPAISQGGFQLYFVGLLPDIQFKNLAEVFEASLSVGKPFLSVGMLLHFRSINAKLIQQSGEISRESGGSKRFECF